jgi:sensor c-di-GMP phosphodiesterase-like protein
MGAAMGMIKGMEMEIVSEGIETKEQYNAMKELGIEYIQGYYFSKPLPEREFVEFMVKARSENK